MPPVSCDLCHARKVKCDRQDPCMNCVDAQVECCRHRRRRPRGRQAHPRVTTARGNFPNRSRPAAVSPQRAEPSQQLLSSTANDGGKNLTENNWSPVIQNGSYTDQRRPLHSLFPNADTGPSLVSGDGATNVHRHSSSAQQARLRHAEPSDSAIPKSPANTASTTQYDSSHQISEASEFLDQELRLRTELSQHRYAVLKAAAEFVNRNFQPSNTFQEPAYLGDPLPERDSRLRPFSSEIFYMMTIGPGNYRDFPRRYFWPDHVSSSTLENMCLALVEGVTDEQTLVHYRICAYTKATFFVTRVSELGHTKRLRDHFQNSRKEYEASALAALNKINILAPPSLSLVQALLSGALLMQIRGEMFQSWRLAAFAAKNIVSLNYHTTTEIFPSTEQEHNIHLALVTCFYLDKSLSLLLLRPPSLPTLKIKPAELVCIDPLVPLTAIMKSVVELAQIQESAIDIILKRHSLNDKSHVALIEKLSQDMFKIFVGLQERRLHPPYSELEYEWLAIDFSYYAILTTILHANPNSAKGPFVRKECLLYARKAFVALKTIQDKISIDGQIPETLPNVLTWTMLFHPLCPFFVLFCNVVNTSDKEDFSLMRAITQGLQGSATTNPSIYKLHRLFSSFLDLCSPLLQRNYDISQTQSLLSSILGDAPADRSHTQLGNQLLSDNTHGVNPGQEQQRSSIGQTASYQAEETAWGTDLVWELFDSQPWLGWMEWDNTYNAGAPLSYD
ncbi:hypothetical protein N7513_001296 [Penicillium frequentans]|nr:hypothetical protein N7513_001296 [Penicillium glabrum]